MIKKYIIPISTLLLICIIFFIKNNKNDEIYEDVYINNETIINEEKEVIDKIKVHIYGQVNNPGLIELNSGDRVLDAIEIAGGTSNEADISKVNLAYILSDGEKIYIPSIKDEYNEKITSMDSNKVNINIASKEEIKTLNGIGDSLAEAIIEYRKKNGKFNNIEDLKNVSGIGENKFEKIKDNICIK